MEATKKSKLFVLGLLAVSIVMAFFGFSAMRGVEKEHKQVMEQVIGERGGQITNIYVASLEESPFEEGGKGNNIYKITYTVNGETHTAWYRAINQSSIKQQPEAWLFE